MRIVPRPPVLTEPLAAFAPDQSPLALQLSGVLVVDQVRLDEPPIVTDIGLADKLTTGFGGNETTSVAVRFALVPPWLLH